MALQCIPASMEPLVAHCYGPAGWMGWWWCTGASGCRSNSDSVAMVMEVGVAAAV